MNGIPDPGRASNVVQMCIDFDEALTTAQRFERFHDENPRVYAVLVRLAREWVEEHGHVRLGIRMLWEVARWELIKATRNADFKLNDHYTGYYSRLIMRNEADLGDLFECRASEADSWIQTYRAAA